MQRRKVQNFSNIRNIFIMKKKRSENFNRSEVEILVDILEKYKIVVENKKLNAAAWAEKKAAWESIAREFNEISVNLPRTWKTLKLKYEGIKKEIKRKYCLIKEHPRKVGNDRLHTELLSSYEEKVLSMMQPRISELQSSLDFQETEQQTLGDCNESIAYDEIKIEDFGDEQEEHEISIVGCDGKIPTIGGDEALSQVASLNDSAETLRTCKAETLEEDERAATIQQDDIIVTVPIPSTNVNYTNLPQIRRSAFKKHINRIASMDTSIMEDVPLQKLMALKRKVLLLQKTLLQDEIESRMQSRQLEKKIMETNLETARIELKIKQKMLEQMG